MAMFVHLTPEKNIKAIQRNGLRRLTKGRQRPSGIYAMPVVRNFYISHQWLRELKRWHPSPVMGVYFRIPDDEMIWVGRYNQGHQAMTAAQALAAIMACDHREGYEVIIPRRVARSEIHRVRRLPQVLGWRYYPDAHGQKPCGCPFCQRGEYGGRKLRERYGED